MDVREFARPIQNGLEIEDTFTERRVLKALELPYGRDGPTS
jgi:hypothetical protein